jgi:3-phosphoshikimate 1-carboxyvinyltransferase
MSKPLEDGTWQAGYRFAPLHHQLSLPGSKSLTNRELVLSALAAGPSILRSPLHARDTDLMVEALRALGAIITEGNSGAYGPDLHITPIPDNHFVQASLDCGLAGTVMRFVPPLSLLMKGSLFFDGDPGARLRPMSTTLDALGQLGLHVEAKVAGFLPFTVTNAGSLAGRVVVIDASASSQFVSGLLLVAARLPEGLRIEHRGDSLPSLPHIDMTLHCLRSRGVDAKMVSPGIWEVAPGAIAGGEVRIEPDLSNAAPFLAAPLITGGSVSVTGWPENTTQVGGLVPELLENWGASITRTSGVITVDGGAGVAGGELLPGVDIDLSHAGELAPTFVALAALSPTRSQFRGIGHLRGHETDRLKALVSNIEGLGRGAGETPDGVVVEEGKLHPGLWKAFDDHRMATSGALIGLAVPGMEVDDISCTSKTLPEFPALWEELLSSPER